MVSPIFNISILNQVKMCERLLLYVAISLNAVVQVGKENDRKTKWNKAERGEQHLTHNPR